MREIITNTEKETSIKRERKKERRKEEKRKERQRICRN